MRRIVLGDDEASAGFLVEPMHDAGARDAADAAELSGAVMQQGVDERAFLVSGGRVHDHAGGLVQHEQIIVFEQDVEGHLLRLRSRGPGVGPVNFDFLSGARRM